MPGCSRSTPIAHFDGQRLFLEALRGAVDAGDAPARHWAYLADRVAMNERRPQRFGTQVADMEDGEAVPWPIEDPPRSTSNGQASGWNR
jgi:hypothetical protein